MKREFLDKLVGRIERIDPENLQGVLIGLAREKGFLEAIFNAIQEGVVIMDGEGRIKYLNPAATELLGITRTRAEGERIAQLLPEVDWETIFSAQKSESESVVSRELEIFHPRHRLLDFYVMVLDGTPTAPASLALILHDVTALRRAATETIESEKLGVLSLLAASVAHELGNPLNALSIHLQLLGRELKNLPPAKGVKQTTQRKKIRESLAVAQGEIERLDYIVSQFLRAIRPARLKLRSESVHHLLEETLDFLGPEIADRGITVERDFSPDLPRIQLDKAQMKQAFFNIIKNATQAMSKGGCLRVATEAPHNQVIITFADTGSGIGPDTMRKITKPYSTTKATGTGLGLLIVRRVIRDHGGDLEIKSAPGHGTTLRISLPIAEKRMRLLEAAKPDSLNR